MCPAPLLLLVAMLLRETTIISTHCMSVLATALLIMTPQTPSYASPRNTPSYLPANWQVATQALTQANALFQCSSGNLFVPGGFFTPLWDRKSKISSRKPPHCSFSQWPEPWQDRGFCQMGAVVVHKKSETRCSPLQLLHIHAKAWKRGCKNVTDLESWGPDLHTM